MQHESSVSQRTTLHRTQYSGLGEASKVVASAQRKMPSRDCHSRHSGPTARANSALPTDMHAERRAMRQSGTPQIPPAKSPTPTGSKSPMREQSAAYRAVQRHSESPASQARLPLGAHRQLQLHDAGSIAESGFPAHGLYRTGTTEKRVFQRDIVRGL